MQNMILYKWVKYIIAVKIELESIMSIWIYTETLCCSKFKLKNENYML